MTDIVSTGPEIYKILGISNSTSLMIIGISGSLSIVYCSIGLWALERFGRVKPLIISAFGLGAALVCNAAMSQHLDPTNGNMLRAMVAMNFVFSLFYTPLGIISWVYPAEIFPVEVRAFGNATTTFTNWTLNLIFAQFTPQALDSIGFRYFYVFFAFNMVAMLCYIFFYPGKLQARLDVSELLLTTLLQKPRVRPSNRWMSCSAISWCLMLWKIPRAPLLLWKSTIFRLLRMLQSTKSCSALVGDEDTACQTLTETSISRRTRHLLKFKSASVCSAPRDLGWDNLWQKV